MKRSTKETEAAQAAAAALYANAFKLHLERAPGGLYAPVDYLARASPRYGAPVVEVLEVKCRSFAVHSLPTVWVEERKVAALRKWGDVYSAPAYFVALFSDGELRRIDVEDLVKAAGGFPVVRRRMDRNDEADTDLVYEVPIASMEVIAHVEGTGRTDANASRPAATDDSQA